ncbi:MAG: type II toxin-antitoxin system VapC family toxin [Sphingomonas sp.]
MLYLPDTNILIAVITRRHPAVIRRMAELRDDIGLSTIVLHELYFGAFNSARIESNLAELIALGLPVLPLDENDARTAGEIRARLKQAGTPIGPYDVLIAGQALARGLTVVTANRREFDRVQGLTVEDWTT